MHKIENEKQKRKKRRNIETDDGDLLLLEYRERDRCVERMIRVLYVHDDHQS